MILNDKQIRVLCKPTTVVEGDWKPMISPFTEKQVRQRECFELRDGNGVLIADIDGEPNIHKTISYGTSSFGYDVRLAGDFKIFSNVNSGIVDPKKLDERCLVDGQVRYDQDSSEYVILPPNSYLLGHTMETFVIPRDVMVVAVGKSTYARAGAIVNVTPIEPGFEGTVVIEVSNSTPLPMKIYANEGIAQFLFFKGEPCETSYGDRGGKYQGQQGIVLPKV